MKSRRSIFSALLAMIAGLSVAFAGAQPVWAQDNSQDSQSDYSHVRVVRLSFVVGDVQYQTQDQDWQTATVNLPLQEGFRLATTNGRSEVEFESGLIVRLAENSGIEFTKLALENGGRVTQLNLTDGSILVNANVKGSDAFTVSAPGLQMTLAHTAKLRLDTAQGDSWVSVFKGDVQVGTGAGDTRLTAGHTLHLAASNGGQISIEDNAALDDFDRWGMDRDRIIQQGYTQVAQYLPTNAPDYSDYDYGLADLSSYGHWTYISGYGYGWQPYGVPLHWLPFGDGCWNFFSGGFGWTWISFEPWGWLPYHTGHWFFSPVVGWVWEPGPFRRWAPAPVQWLRVGNQVGWVPRGTLGSNGEPPAIGVVTGFRDPRGIIRTGSGSGPVVPRQGIRIAQGTPPEPVFRGRVGTVGNSGGGGAGIPVVGRPLTPGPVFDPVTKTYVNENPPMKRAPVNPIAGPIPLDKEGPVRPNHTVGLTPSPTMPTTPVHVDTPRPAPTPAPVMNAPRYNPPPAPPPQHYSPPPAPPAQHYSPPPPPPPAPHTGGGSSSGGHSGGSSSSGHR
ncbi:MAG TPA: FecR family protein [Candidatus Acidoferrales bacterium]|nr:FecR family protein [Candidatus Acidoferrales bacterium]